MNKGGLKVLLIDETFNKELIQLPTIDFIKSQIVIDDYGIPIPNINEYMDRTMETLKIRGEYVKHSLPILSHEFMISIKKLTEDLKIKRIAELSCGIGWLSYWLRKYGVRIEASIDNMSWYTCPKGRFLSHVTKGSSISYVKEHPGIGLFILSWPCMDTVATRIWNVMKKNQYLLYIGERYDGCTANKSFHRKVEDKEVESNGLNSFFISFWGIHDKPFLYRK